MQHLPPPPLPRPPPPLPPPTPRPVTIVPLSKPLAITPDTLKDARRLRATVGNPGRGAGSAVANTNFVREECPTADEMRLMGVTKAMRVLDAARKHNVTGEEEKELGVCGRLDVQA